MIKGTLVAWGAARAVTVAVALGIAVSRRNLALFPRVFLVWDGRWYLKLVEHGYPHVIPTGPSTPSTLAFFPLYPLVVRLFGGTAAAAVFVAWASGAVATVLVARVAHRVMGERYALPAAIAFSLFPGAFILSFAYAEGLAIALAAACLLALLDRKWVWAGVAAALASAARPNAVVLVACCALAAWQARERRAWVAPALAPTGAAAVVVVQWFVTGSPTAWFRAEAAGWQQHFDFGASAARLLAAFILGPFGHPAIFMIGVGMLVCGVLVLEMRHLRLPTSLGWYTAGILVLTYTSSMFNGRPRFLLTAFPLVFPLARLPRRAFVAVMAVSVVAMALLTWYAAVQAVIPP